MAHQQQVIPVYTLGSALTRCRLLLILRRQPGNTTIQYCDIEHMPILRDPVDAVLARNMAMSGCGRQYAWRLHRRRQSGHLELAQYGGS